MKKLFYIIIGVIFYLNGYSQNLASEIANINKAFYKDNNIAMEITSKFYIDNSNSSSKESKTYYYKIPGSYLVKVANTESMANSNYKINVDNNKKTIIVNSVTKATPKTNKGLDNMFESKDYFTEMDTLLSFYKKVSIKNIDSQTNEILFEFKEGAYEYVKISYNKTTYQVLSYSIKFLPTDSNSKDGKKHTYTYIIANKYLDKNILTKKFFSEENYFIKSKGKLLPTSKYSTYQIIDNSKNKS